MTVRAASLAITIFDLDWSPEICFIEELASKIITTSLSFGEAVAANADLKLNKVSIWQKHIAQCLAVITHIYRGRRGRDRLVVEFTITYAISAYHHWCCEFESRSGRGVLDTTLCDKVCQWLWTGRWFSPGPPVSSINKTDRHVITEILLKVALNTTK